MTAPTDTDAIPAPHDVDFAARVAAHLDHRVGCLVEAAARVRSRADDNAIHDLRVCARRLGALLSLWRALLRRKARRRAARRLRDLRRALGPAREAEVNLEHLAERVAREPRAVRVAAGELLLRLRHDVGRGRRDAARRASQSSVEALLRRLATAREPLVPRARSMPDPAAEARARLGRYASGAQHAIAEARARGDDEAFHDARVAIKRWRYAAEGLAAAGPESPATDARVLRKAQQVLGEAHDRAVLRDLVARESERLTEAGLYAQAAALRNLEIEIDGERREAIERFQELAPSLAARIET